MATVASEILLQRMATADAFSSLRTRRSIDGLVGSPSKLAAGWITIAVRFHHAGFRALVNDIVFDDHSIGP